MSKNLLTFVLFLAAVFIISENIDNRNKDLSQLSFSASEVLANSGSDSACVDVAQPQSGTKIDPLHNNRKCINENGTVCGLEHLCIEGGPGDWCQETTCGGSSGS